LKHQKVGGKYIYNLKHHELDAKKSAQWF